MRNQNNFGYIPDEDHGYIPDEFVPEDVAEFDAMTGKYEQSGQPGIVSWDSFEAHVREQADTMDKIRSAGWIVLWWFIAKFQKIPIWDSNQGQLGSCAGWSAANGHMITVLYQMLLGSFRFVLINPLAMWVRTKNWSMSGGQSMSKVMMGGNSFGNYPVEQIGNYSTRLTAELKQRIESTANVATHHQFGACRLSQTAGGSSAMKSRQQTVAELVAKIVLCLRAGMVVCIGNSVRVSGCKTDKNGMRVATLGGTWSHATLFDGYIVVNGTVYLHWTNSHGKNKSSESDPICIENGRRPSKCWGCKGQRFRQEYGQSGEGCRYCRQGSCPSQPCGVHRRWSGFGSGSGRRSNRRTAEKKPKPRLNRKQLPVQLIF
jgi:hypothetical protein